jgi:hypothetical protein
MFAKSRPVPELMLPNPPPKIISDADVKRLRAVGEDINAVATVVGGIHRSFASLRMTLFGLCPEEMQNSVTGCTPKL